MGILEQCAFWVSKGMQLKKTFPHSKNVDFFFNETPFETPFKKFLNDHRNLLKTASRAVCLLDRDESVHAMQPRRTKGQLGGQVYSSMFQVLRSSLGQCQDFNVGSFFFNEQR